MEDYNKVLFPIEPYRCRFCGLTLVVDGEHSRSSDSMPPADAPTATI
jgi:hypothetical protein